MAKYSVKFEIEVIVDENFEVDEIDELTTEQWNEIVSNAISNMDTDDLSENIVEIARVKDEYDREIEMPWDYGKHFD